MIFIDRTKIARPLKLNPKGIYYRTEVLDAQKELQQHGNLQNAKFKLYKDNSVRDALIELFHSKCAYCETIIRMSQPGDVEHFRPKKEVKIKDDKTYYFGYYWLAADWNNLIYSCRNCNVGMNNHLQDGSFRVVGKANFFPLSDNSKYIDSPSEDISLEENYRLLIDPCKDDPEDLLLYEQSTGNIKAKHKKGFKKEKAEESIEVLGLHRMSLVHARKKAIQETLLQINRIKDISKLQQQTEGAVRLKLTEMLNLEIEGLKEMIKPAAQYSAVAKQTLIKNKHLISSKIKLPI